MSTLTDYTILSRTLLIDAEGHGSVTVEITEDLESTVGDLLESAGLDFVELRTWSEDFPSFSYPIDPSGLINSPVEDSRRAFHVTISEGEDGNPQVNLLEGPENANGLVAVPLSDDETADLTDAMDAVEIWESHTYGEVSAITLRDGDTIIGQMTGITEPLTDDVILEFAQSMLDDHMI